MKKIKLFTLSIFSLFLSYSVSAQCDSCSVNAFFSVSQTPSCQLILIDLSTADSCSTYIYGVVNYGNGIVDTISPGDTIPDKYGNGTFYMCLTAYAIQTDSLGTDTCQDTYCRYVTKSVCHNPFRVKSSNSEIDFAKVFPNPAIKNVTIAVGEQVNQISVFSIDGKLVFSQITTELKLINLNLEEWDSGIYFVKTEKENESDIQKLIIQ